MIVGAGVELLVSFSDCGVIGSTQSDLRGLIRTRKHWRALLSLDFGEKVVGIL